MARRVRRTDWATLNEMHNEPSVMVTLGGLRSEAETTAYLEKNIAHWERYGYGLWMLQSKLDQSIVGRCALRHIEIEGKSEVEVGYALMPAYWGQGLATEAACAVVSIGFEHVGFESLVAIGLPTNAASVRVMERAGAVYERDVMHADQRHVLYRFTGTCRAG